jgi:hypothetical protein
VERGGGVALSETTIGMLTGAGATAGGSLVTGLLAFLATVACAMAPRADVLE